MNQLLEDFYKKPIAMQAVRMSKMQTVAAGKYQNQQYQRTLKERSTYTDLMDDSSLGQVNCSIAAATAGPVTHGGGGPHLFDHSERLPSVGAGGLNPLNSMSMMTGGTSASFSRTIG